jgi:hypothetical protein
VLPHVSCSEMVPDLIVCVCVCVWFVGSDDFVAFLRRCKIGLRPHGVICLKENISRDGFVLDRSDASVTRCELALFVFRVLVLTFGQNRPTSSAPV